MQQQMIKAIQLPKTELMKFDGDPFKFWLFIRAFENSSEGTGVSDSVKLNRLFQYCTGKALKESSAVLLWNQNKATLKPEDYC